MVLFLGSWNLLGPDVHFWESSRIGIERFHSGFGIGVGTDPLFYKILKPKSNSWWVPSCDLNHNQIGFLITIWFCFRFLSGDLLVNSQLCNFLFVFHIRDFLKTLVIPEVWNIISLFLLCELKKSLVDSQMCNIIFFFTYVNWKITCKVTNV